VGDSLDTIFKAYDVRGVYPDQIDEGVAKKVGNAFVRFTGASTVIVGHDMRPSSVPLVKAFIEGATLAGADVVDVGLASTDLVYFAAGSLDAPAAMFTASHNPAQYNGIKLCRAGAAPVGEATGLTQIKEAVAAGLLERAEESGKVIERDLLDDFADHVRSFIDVDALRPLKVVADTANGMGGLVVPKVFEGLPCELTVLFGELDGTFPNHPADPIQVEVYGANMPINQVATISVPEPRLLTVQVWDRSNITSVEKAIRNAGLGINPIVDGQLIRLPIPDLTEERRKELAKLAGQYAEKARIAVRNVRRDGMDALKTDEKKHEISEDEHKRLGTEVQKMTDDTIKEIDTAAHSKEQEILGK